ncbi:MAG: DNA adenine methylase [Treponema sp.]|jgi:adenine-specific DNA-methyltransferase|nr:DNA adenine methylase [Treponema sp.]
MDNPEPPVVQSEDSSFLTRQLITYIGNKRALLDFIGLGIKRVQKKLNRARLSIFDVFSGSGIVARYCKQYAKLLIVNDLEKYSALINQCYLSNKTGINFPELRSCYNELLFNLSPEKLRPGLIAGLYAPKDENHIGPGDRVFYTVRNAMYIDTARRLIGGIPEDRQKFFIAPLLSEASIHANTSGVFKGFYKNRETGVGQFGGKNQDALMRIRGNIALPFPVFSSFDADVLVYNGDANDVINRVPEVDMAYLDPPYNQHPYGSNYFMLNLIADYQYPGAISSVSGIPENWNRSSYNKENRALAALTGLAGAVKAKYLLISFNSRGFIKLEEMKAMLQTMGQVEVLETNYNTFRGGRNPDKREIHVKEYLYLLEK